MLHVVELIPGLPEEEEFYGRLERIAHKQLSSLAGLVLAATVSVGTIAFLLPLQGLHRRIRDEKEAELERVREAIHRDRKTLLSTGSEAAAATTRM